MKDEDKSKEQLVNELEELRRRVAKLGGLETDPGQTNQGLPAGQDGLRSLLDYSPEPIIIYDTEGRVLYINFAFTRTFGWSPEEVLERRIDHVPEESWPQTKDALKRLFKGEQVPPFDTKRLTKDGKVLDIHISSALFRDKTGLPAGHIVTLRDITESKRAEETLNRSREQLRLITDTLLAAVAHVDKQYRYLWVNQTYEQWMKVSREEVRGLSVAEVLGDVFFQAIEKHFAAALSGKHVTFEIRVPFRDGRTRDVRATYTPEVGASGEVNGVVALIADISDLKRAAQERETLLFELQNALTEVKKLSGFLPICASCKKVRDDQGYWRQIEAYIRDHSEAEFSHSICPDCARKLYPELYQDKSDS